ncbi:MAG: hypothetical protein FWC91_05000 [Defluviitaleaceae bacterium]|nr:hypothetical protein [Defluviitaleaceae bacterium]
MSGSTTEVPDQIPKSFAGNHRPIVQDVVYVRGSMVRTYMATQSFLTLVTGVENLQQPTDFILLGDVIVFMPEFLETLPVGRNMITVAFHGGQRVNAFIVVEEGIPEPPTFVNLEATVNIAMWWAAMPPRFEYIGVTPTVLSIQSGNTNLIPDMHFAIADDGVSTQIVILPMLFMGMQPGQVLELEITFSNLATQVVTLRAS